MVFREWILFQGMLEDNHLSHEVQALQHPRRLDMVLVFQEVMALPEVASFHQVVDVVEEVSQKVVRPVVARQVEVLPVEVPLVVVTLAEDILLRVRLVVEKGLDAVAVGQAVQVTLAEEVMVRLVL